MNDGTKRCFGMTDQSRFTDDDEAPPTEPYTRRRPLRRLPPPLPPRALSRVTPPKLRPSVRSAFHTERHDALRAELRAELRSAATSETLVCARPSEPTLDLIFGSAPSRSLVFTTRPALPSARPSSVRVVVAEPVAARSSTSARHVRDLPAPSPVLPPTLPPPARPAPSFWLAASLPLVGALLVTLLAATVLPTLGAAARQVTTNHHSKDSQ